MFRECEEGGVFFAYAIEDADGAVFFAGEPDDFAAGAAEFALQRLDVLGRCLEMLLEELLENVQGHGFNPQPASGAKAPFMQPLYAGAEAPASKRQSKQSLGDDANCLP